MNAELFKKILDKSKGKNPEFYEKYEKIDDEPIGTGMSAEVWRVKKKGQENSEIYAAKEIIDGWNWMFKGEVKPLSRVNHPNIVKMEESFENSVTGGVIVTNFHPRAKELKAWLAETKGTLLPKKQMIEMQI
jgi:proline racemase